VPSRVVGTAQDGLGLLHGIDLVGAGLSEAPDDPTTVRFDLSPEKKFACRITVIH
jgi:hypothetical protein